jgi:hypothetical protein
LEKGTLDRRTDIACDIEVFMPTSKAVSSHVVQRETVSDPGRAIEVQKLTLSSEQRQAVSRAIHAGRAAQTKK